MRTSTVTAAEPRMPREPVTIDIRRDRRGEFFDIATREGVGVEVLDLDRRIGTCCS